MSPPGALRMVSRQTYRWMPLSCVTCCFSLWKLQVGQRWSWRRRSRTADAGRDCAEPEASAYAQTVHRKIAGALEAGASVRGGLTGRQSRASFDVLSENAEQECHSGRRVWPRGLLFG